MTLSSVVEATVERPSALTTDLSQFQVICNPQQADIEVAQNGVLSQKRGVSAREHLRKLDVRFDEAAAQRPNGSQTATLGRIADSRPFPNVASQPL